MIESLGTIIEYIQTTGDVWLVIALVLFGTLMREIADHKKYTKEISETTINKDIAKDYTKALETNYENLRENYKILTEMLEKLTCMLAKLTENYIITESGHNVSLEKILTTIQERLPKSHD